MVADLPRSTTRGTARIRTSESHAQAGHGRQAERQARDICYEDRWRIWQEKAAPLVKALHNRMLTQRDLVPNGSATAKALDYNLKRLIALTR
jgi:hypothetical protein